MSSLYIYGDSFAVDWEEPWVWQRQIAPRLGIDKVVVQGCAGCANEWTLKLFQQDQHKPKDIVIFFITDPSRQWWFEDRPSLCNLSSIMDTKEAQQVKDNDRDKFEAIVNYYAHLQNDKIDRLRLEMMIDFIKVKAIEREVILQVIPCFDMQIDWTDLNPCKGNMTTHVCDREFANMDDLPTWYEQSIDTRANHMTIENHTRFANKLLHRFVKGGAIDLTQGFETGFLKLSDKLTHPGLCPKLVEMAMEPGNTIPKEHFPIKR